MEQQASLNIMVKSPEQAQAILAFAAGYKPTTITGKTTKAQAAVTVSDDTDLDNDDFDTPETDTDLDEDFDTPPAKTTKAAKVTEKEVNAAAMAHAKANGGKKATLTILKNKFKVASILELKPEQYAAVIKALAI